MAELLKEIAATFRGLRKKQVDDYTALVHRIAAGDKVDPGRATEILDGANKTPEELQADVQLHQHRLELRATVDAAPSLDAEEKRLRKQAAAADRIWEAADKAHDDVIYPLTFRLEQIAAARQAANRARAELLKTSPAELQEQRRELEAEIAAVSTASTGKKIAARDCRENIRKLGLTPPAQESFDPWDKRGKREVAEVAQRIEAEQGRLGELETAVATLEEERTALVTQREALEAQQLMA